MELAIPLISPAASTTLQKRDQKLPVTPEKNAIKLEPHSRTCIDLKIVLEIPATTMVQLASQSSLANREINIRGGIIDTEYVGNIIAMLQNDSEKAYIIEPNKKIAQAIFLLFKNNFKVAITPDVITLEYYQSIYTHCKQRFNIPDGIEVVKKSVYQYIENRINNYLFGNYNISEVRSNLYNNLVHYSQLETKDLNKLNFNIIKYCEETYPVQSQYSIDFESETETSNKGKQKLKQYSKTTLNTPILPKTTAKHLKTPEQGTKNFTSSRSPTRQQEPLQTSSNLLDFLAENRSEHSKTAANEENDFEISEEESIDSENKEDKMTAYIAKIPEFNGEDIETSPQKWLDQVTKTGDANGWNAARILTTSFNDWTAFKTAFLEQFTNNNTLITL
ncbi:hypothetical protein G9A89_022560 [Geosiphon pyriformis]|nr:hypothetical protein G9A89_022560 [Geosiphon pyriformis]